MRLSGPANVLIMPAIHSASISTKLVQGIGGATVLGPLVLGLSKPVQICPLSASVSQILTMATFAAYDIRAPIPDAVKQTGGGGGIELLLLPCDSEEGGPERRWKRPAFSPTTTLRAVPLPVPLRYTGGDSGRGLAAPGPGRPCARPARSTGPWRAGRSRPQPTKKMA